MNNRYIYKFLIFFTLLVSSSNFYNYSVDFDNYYKNLFRNNGVKLDTLDLNSSKEKLPKNLVTTDPVIVYDLMSYKFDNLLFICKDFITPESCLGFNSIKDLDIEKLTLFPKETLYDSSLSIYSFKYFNRNIYIIPEYTLMSVNYSNYIFKYFQDLLHVNTTENAFNYGNYISFLFEFLFYIFTLLIVYFLVKTTIDIRLRRLEINKIKDYFGKLTSVILPLLFILLILQPFIVFFYSKIYDKSAIHLDTFKTLYISSIFEPRFYTTMDLFIYLVQVVNILIIITALFIISIPYTFKVIPNIKITKFTFLSIFFIFAISTILTYISLKSQIGSEKLFDDSNVIRGDYYITKNTYFNDVFLSSKRNIFINNYLVSHSSFSEINNLNLDKFYNLQNNLLILSENLDETIKTIFYLSDNFLLLDSLNADKSSVQYFENLSYDPTKEYLIDISIECLYDTNPFTYSIYIYSKEQIENKLGPEKIDFYNFSGCEKGDFLSLRLPFSRFNLYNQDAVMILKAREQESNPEVDTNGLKHSFKLVQDSVLIQSTSLKIDNSRILYENITDNDSNDIYVYSLSSKEFNLNNQDQDKLNITKIVKTMLERDLIRERFLIWEY